MKDAIVIGAGIAGIASAIRLAVKGYRVTVYEANAYPGGKLSEIFEDGYRFDAGPSLFTMPQYVEELFQLTGKNPESYGFEYKRLEVLCNYFYPDGTQIKAWSQPEKFAAEIAAKTTDSFEAVLRFLAKSQRIYSITNHVFLEKSLHQLKTYLSADTLKSVLRIAEIDSMRSMNQANESFFKDQKTVQLFNRYATYNGSNPYKAPATLNVIPHLEYHYGAYFPLNGMNSITSSLVKLAGDCGVKFLYNSPVNEIVVKDGAIAGVRVHNNFEPASIVVSNMDVWFTYKKLLPKFKAPGRILEQERSSSALLFYWGIKAQFPKLDLHNIFFSANYKAEFETI